MDIPKSQKIYFFSDAHLGIPNYVDSLKREKLLVSCLDEVKTDAFEIYLLGDIFDFWFEYKTVVPKGYVRLLGKIAELTDSGIKVHYFTGNHDMWVFDYFKKELGVSIHRKPISETINGKKFFIGHGDGLGPGDKSYKRLKKIFSSRLCQKLFSYLHPGFGSGLAMFFSRRSRLVNGANDEIFLGEDKERLIQYCHYKLKDDNIDYFIFGHRHLPMDIEIKNGSRYINTGDWFNNFSYAVFDGNKVELKYFPVK
ncbi:MAG: UDP-2,3-diacylglucosamine diphosphatase [Bacteroidota bacterium]